jgi:hypothetical protein
MHTFSSLLLLWSRTQRRQDPVAVCGRAASPAILLSGTPLVNEPSTQIFAQTRIAPGWGNNCDSWFQENTSDFFGNIGQNKLMVSIAFTRGAQKHSPVAF